MTGWTVEVGETLDLITAGALERTTRTSFHASILLSTETLVV